MFITSIIFATLWITSINNKNNLNNQRSNAFCSRPKDCFIVMFEGQLYAD